MAFAFISAWNWVCETPKSEKAGDRRVEPARLERLALGTGRSTFQAGGEVMEFQRGKEYLRPPDADLSWPAELIAQAATFVGRLPLVIETLDGRKLAGVLDKPTDDAVQLASFYDDDQVIDVRYNKIARFIMPHEPPPDTSGETRGT